MNSERSGRTGDEPVEIAVISIHPLLDTRIANHLETLVADGLRVAYLNWSDDECRLPERKHSQAVDLIHRQGSRRIGLNPFRYLQLLFWFFRSIRRLRPKLVHCHDLFLFPLAIPLKWFTRTRMVWDLHENFLAMQDIQRPFARWCFRIALPAVDGVAATCPANLPECDQPTVVVPNCQSRWEFESVPATVAPGSDGIPTVVTVSYFGTLLNQYRDLDALVRCAEICMTRFDHVRFQIGGILSGVDAERFAARFEQFAGDYPDRFDWFGMMPRDEVVRQTRNADVGLIFFRPSASNIHGGSWNKVYEYLAVGAAIVATEGCDIEDRIVAEQVGVLFPAGSDAGTIGDALAGLLSDPERLRAMQSNSRRLGEEYSWERCSQEYLRLYDRIDPEIRRPDAGVG